MVVTFCHEPYEGFSRLTQYSETKLPTDLLTGRSPLNSCRVFRTRTRGPLADGCAASYCFLLDFCKETRPREVKRCRPCHLGRWSTSRKPSVNSLLRTTTHGGEDVARAVRLAAHKASGGAADTFDPLWSEEFNTIAGDDKFWAAQVRYAAWDFQARGAKRLLPLVAVPKHTRAREPALASATASVPVLDSTHLQKLKDGIYRTDNNGFEIYRELSRSHGKCSDPFPRQLSHVCIRCPQAGVLPMCSRSVKAIVLPKANAAGSVSECHTLPRRQLVAPVLWLPSWLGIFLRYSQQKGQLPVHFVAPSPGNAVAARLASVGILAVDVGDGDADNPLGLTVLTSDDHFLATIHYPPDWFVVSIQFDSLVLGAGSVQGFRSLRRPVCCQRRALLHGRASGE